MATNIPQGPGIAQDFVRHLTALAERDRGALAALRRSLSFEPGGYPPCYPIVERFVGPERHADDAYRKALYLVAGLFSLHPVEDANSTFASAFGRLKRERESDSIEKRFIALLASDPDSLPTHLRHAVSLLAADGIAFDYALLLSDVARWLPSHAYEARDKLRQRWARDFYRALTPNGGSQSNIAETSAPTPLSA